MKQHQVLLRRGPTSNRRVRLAAHLPMARRSRAREKKEEPRDGANRVPNDGGRVVRRPRAVLRRHRNVRQGNGHLGRGEPGAEFQGL